MENNGDFMEILMDIHWVILGMGVDGDTLR
jgi:hypothetical protein